MDCAVFAQSRVLKGTGFLAGGVWLLVGDWQVGVPEVMVVKVPWGQSGVTALAPRNPPAAGPG